MLMRSTKVKREQKCQWDTRRCVLHALSSAFESTDDPRSRFVQEFSGDYGKREIVSSRIGFWNTPVMTFCDVYRWQMLRSRKFVVHLLVQHEVAGNNAGESVLLAYFRRRSTQGTLDSALRPQRIDAQTLPVCGVFHERSQSTSSRLFSLGAYHPVDRHPSIRR